MSTGLPETDITPIIDQTEIIEILNWVEKRATNIPSVSIQDFKIK